MNVIEINRGNYVPGANYELDKEIEKVKSLLSNATTVKNNGKYLKIARAEIHKAHNIYASSIYLINNDGGAEAYYADGNFWLARNGSLVELN